MGNRVVYKYALLGAGVVQVELPAGSRPVHFAAQHDVLNVWVDRPEDVEATETHEFLIRGTGDPYSAVGWRHIGSTLVDGGLFVFHCLTRVV